MGAWEETSTFVGTLATMETIKEVVTTGEGSGGGSGGGDIDTGVVKNHVRLALLPCKSTIETWTLCSPPVRGAEGV